MVQAASIENRLPKEASIAVPQTNLKAFATANRLKGYRLDECDDPEIVGRFGHLFEWSPSIWGVCLEGAGTLALENRKRMGLAAGMDLWQECDFGESILLFDPGDRQIVQGGRENGRNPPQEASCAVNNRSLETDGEAI